MNQEKTLIKGNGNENKIEYNIENVMKNSKSNIEQPIEIRCTKNSLKPSLAGKVRESGNENLPADSDRKSIAYQNKDIASQFFTQMMLGKSLNVYGFHLPKIIRALPTNLPTIEANELKIDDLFELAGGELMIIDYESVYREEDKLKYLGYVLRTLKRYRKVRGVHVKIRIAVIYTGDVKPRETRSTLDAGAVKLSVERAFLSNLDGDKMESELAERIAGGGRLTEEEVMRFVIFPLTYKGKTDKQAAVQRAFDLARQLEDEEQKVQVFSGIVVFADKIVDTQIADQMKGWIAMTKVGRLFYEEKMQALIDQKREIAMHMLLKGISADIISDCIAGMTDEELEELEAEVFALSPCTT